MAEPGDADTWLARIGPVGRPRVRLVCIPHAGGGTATFRPLGGELSPDVDLCAVRLPGRETRRREPPVRRMDALVESLVAVLDQRKDLPLALFGYCSGALTAYELARELVRAGRPAPVHLFACASPSPSGYGRHLAVHRMPAPELVDYLRRMDVMPESILADPALFALFEPGIRADFELFEAEPYRPGPPLEVPITALGSRGDASVPLGDLVDWSGHTAADFAVRLYAGGGHAFFTSATRRLARTIAAELLPDGPER